MLVLSFYYVKTACISISVMLKMSDINVALLVSSIVTYWWKITNEYDSLISLFQRFLKL